MIIAIILCVISFVLGGGLTYTVLAAGIYAAAKDGEFAGAFYSKKRDRWEVIGNYMTVAGKIGNILKSDSAAEKLHYVDLDPKPKTKDSVSKRFKVKLGIKRSGKSKSSKFKQSE